MIAAYLRERFRPSVFVPLAVFVAFAASSGRVDIIRLSADACVALLLLLEFRLWDDLADREADASHHPHRVLVKASSAMPWQMGCGALTATNLVICVVRGGASIALPVLLTLHAALAALYALRSGRTIAGDQLLLAKYPAFVVIVAGARAVEWPLPIAAAALALYAAASLYEAWHDPASPVAALLGGRS